MPAPTLRLIVTESLAWKQRGACVGIDPDLFFPETKRPRVVEEGPVVSASKAICATCTVRDECREYALSRPECAGTWGGLTEHELRQIRKRRNR
jgi:WhiB family redox-sensing transcriptional regulator